MREYWDSSALVAATLDTKVRKRLGDSDAMTRTHALAEVFSTLTGSRLGFRVDPDDATRVIRDLVKEVELTDLSVEEVMAALAEARSRGVRGGQVHDYLHAAAARRAQCQVLISLNLADFEGLVDDLKIVEA